MDNENNSTSGNRSVGPIIGLVVIIAIVLLGGIYFWMTRNSEYSLDNGYGGESAATSQEQREAAAITAGVPSDINDITAIEAAINSTSIEDEI